MNARASSAARSERGAAVATLAAALALGTVLGGCASAPKPDLAAGKVHAKAAIAKGPIVTGPKVANDPWEAFNRRMYNFNEAVDIVLVKPASQIYQGVVPQPVRLGFSNMLHNLEDIWTAANMLLQGKVQAALDTTIRIGMNSVFGLGGWFDVAEEAGLERSPGEDFGQTLGVWGVPSGPYLVLPLLGPSTVRDGAALLTVDLANSGPSLVLHEPRDRNAAGVIRTLDTRVKLLTAGKVLDEIALDKYVFMRDAFLARRRSMQYDGNPPEDEAPAPSAPAAPASSSAPEPAANPSSAAASAAAPAAPASAAR